MEETTDGEWVKWEDASAWEHNARELLAVAIESVRELTDRCEDVVHKRQLEELLNTQKKWN